MNWAFISDFSSAQDFLKQSFGFYPDDGLTSDVKYRTGGLGVYVFLPGFSALNSVFSFEFRKFSFVFGLLSFLGVGQ